MTDHYFLQECNDHQLELNFNGMCLAENTAKLGLQRRLLVPRCLKTVIRKSKLPLSLIDCFVLRIYPVYFLEFFGETSKKGSKCQIRSLQSAEYL